MTIHHLAFGNEVQLLLHSRAHRGLDQLWINLKEYKHKQITSNFHPNLLATPSDLLVPMDQDDA